MKIVRLLEYEFPSAEAAIAHLQNRGVKGKAMWAQSTITEKFYWTDPEVCRVLNQVVTPVEEGEPPKGTGRCKYYPRPGDSPVCYAGSDVSGAFVCTEQYALSCEACAELEAKVVPDGSK
jgi:hypothetical protein